MNLKLSAATAIAICGIIIQSSLTATELKYTNRKNTLKWFEGARLGIFIHWDPRSDCADKNKNGEMDKDIRPMSKKMQEYAMWGDKGNEAAWKDWNPSKFNADEWVDMVNASGAKYMTFTTMHMWCFSNFDNPATKFDIMSTPFRRDVTHELAMAAAEKGIPVFWYFNMFPSKHIKGKKQREKIFWGMAQGDLAKTRNWEKFRETGVHTLLLHPETYGKVAGMWCDGGGKFSPEAAKDFYKKILQVQPWMIFSPRHGHPDMPKDYRVPEQKLPKLNWNIQQEMTMPIESDIWFWCLGKKSNTKDAEYTIQILIQTAVRDANLAVNISPRGDGAIDETQKKTLLGLGRWVKIYGESIFDTRGGPYEPTLLRGGSTQKGNKVYLHLTQLAQDGIYTLPKLPANIESFRILGVDSAGLNVTQDEKKLTVKMKPSLAFDKSVIDRVVELTLDKDAWKMLPEKVISVKDPEVLKAKATASSENTYKRPSGKKVGQPASSVLEATEHGAGWSASEPWSAKGLDPDPWLMLDFGSVQPFQYIFLKENHSRIQQFVIEYKEKDSSSWKEIFQGKRLNYLSLKFASPISARYVKIRFPKVDGGAPQISKFLIYR